MGRTFLYILLLIALPAAAQIYKYTDANGNTVYSDHSPDGVRRSRSSCRHSTASSHRHRARQRLQAPTTPAARSAYEVLELTGLPSEEALRANNGTFTVNVLISRACRRRTNEAGAGRRALRPAEQRADPATGEC
jgi:hypothetical protein